MSLSWTIVIPVPRFDQRVWRAQVDLYKQWRAEYEAAHPAPPIENIRFKVDQHWRSRFASVSNAAEGARFWKGNAHPVWAIVELVWYAALATWVVGAVAMATIGWWAF